MINIETKVRLNNLVVIKNQIDAFASFVGKLKQRDTYFILGEKRLKAREEPNRFEIIYYNRKDGLTPRKSHYLLYNFNEFFFLLTKLVLRVFLGTKRIVEKERYLYLYKNTRIHVDDVKSLGVFLELETVVSKGGLYNEFKKEHEEISTKLQLDTMEKIPGSYSDLTNPAQAL